MTVESVDFVIIADGDCELGILLLHHNPPPVLLLLVGLDLLLDSVSALFVVWVHS